MAKKNQSEKDEQQAAQPAETTEPHGENPGSASTAAGEPMTDASGQPLKGEAVPFDDPERAAEVGYFGQTVDDRDYSVEASAGGASEFDKGDK